MKLSKKQEKAISIAIDVIDTILGNGIDSEELDFAINILIEMKDKSIATKAYEKRKKEYLKNYQKIVRDK